VFEALFKDLLLNVSPSAGQHTSHISWNPKARINNDPTPQPYNEPDESIPQLQPTSLLSTSMLPSHLHLYPQSNKKKPFRVGFIQLQRPSSYTAMVHIWKSVKYVCYEGDTA